MQVSETLDVVGEGGDRGFRCRRCEHSLGPITENFKLTALIEQAPLSEANPRVGDPHRYVDETMVFRRFYCPGCGTLIDTEVARERDVPLMDIELA